MNNIQIEIPSLSENIRIVESFIDNAKEQFSLNDDIYGNMMIAVTESVNNAILHGNLNDAEKNVSLSLSVHAEVLHFKIIDEGSGFNHNELPDPTSPENIDKPGGRGIFLMKHLCDEVAFNKDGREVVLSFYLNQ